MILLTEHELLRACSSAEAIAKAQLRKVVECGGSFCEEHRYFGKRFDCPLCLRELEKEAGL